MSGFSFSNELISRDEELHTDFTQIKKNKLISSI